MIEFKHNKIEKVVKIRSIEEIISRLEYERRSSATPLQWMIGSQELGSRIEVLLWILGIDTGYIEIPKEKTSFIDRVPYRKKSEELYKKHKRYWNARFIPLRPKSNKSSTGALSLSSGFTTRSETRN